MALKFDEFLRGCVEDTVNDGSGDWPKPVKGEAAAYAKALKLDAHEVNEGRGGEEIRLGTGLCIHCGARVSRAALDSDGWCARCDTYDPARDYELSRERVAARRQQAHQQAANLLRRLAEDKGLNATFRATLLEEAELLERRAS